MLTKNSAYTVEIMDLGILYSETLLVANVVISIAITRKLSTLFQISPLSSR